MGDHLGHLALILAPLIFVALFRFRLLLPVLALLLLLHQHADPLPGSASPTPPPICCTLAQSLEPGQTEAPAVFLVLLVVLRAAFPRRPSGFLIGPPAIRAPPRWRRFPPPASWTPEY
jgi:hypothetical protein